MFKGVAVQCRRRKFGGEATSSLLLHRPTEVPLH